MGATLDEEPAKRFGRDEQELAGQQKLVGYPMSDGAPVRFDGAVEQVRLRVLPAAVAGERARLVEAARAGREPLVCQRRLVPRERLGSCEVGKP